MHCFSNTAIHLFIDFSKGAKCPSYSLGTSSCNESARAGFQETGHDLPFNLPIVGVDVAENAIVPFESKEPGGVQWSILFNN